MRLNWIRKVLVSASLGHRRRDRLRLAAYHLRIVAGIALRRPEPGPVTVALAPDGHRVTVSHSGELSVLHDMLVAGEYDIDGTPAVIFDLGANVGFAALAFHRRHPSARVIAVEADPSTYEKLKRNVSGLRGVETVHCAASDEDGTVDFFSSESSISSSMTRLSASDRGVRVPARSLATLMADAGVERVDLLKLDIEGAEFDVLRSAPLERVGEVLAEVHYDLAGGDEATVRELLADFDLRFDPLPQPQRCIVRGRRRS